jgi:hypothetical protein
MRLVLLLGLAALVLPGCLSCQPLVDVRHCTDQTGDCEPRQGDPVVDWNPDLGDLWPDIARLMASTAEGRHEHATWSNSEAAAFWAFWNVPADRAEKQVFLRHDGELFRVRILAC